MPHKRCAECGRPVGKGEPSGEVPSRGSCPSCGAPVNRAALTEFASRLARFGLDDERKNPLVRSTELPDAG